MVGKSYSGSNQSFGGPVSSPPTPLIKTAESEQAAVGFTLTRLAIHQEPGFLRDLVIEPHRRGIGFVGVPIHSAAACAFRLPIDLFDQRAAYSFASCPFGSKQVLQVADRLDRDRRAMKEEVRQAK
jgi:hypothetical protein